MAMLSSDLLLKYFLGALPLKSAHCVETAALTVGILTDKTGGCGVGRGEAGTQ